MSKFFKQNFKATRSYLFLLTTIITSSLCNFSDVVVSHGQSLKKDDQGHWYDPNTARRGGLDSDTSGTVNFRPEDHVPYFPLLEFIAVLAFFSIFYKCCSKRSARKGYTAVDSSDSLKVELTI